LEVKCEAASNTFLPSTSSPSVQDRTHDENIFKA
jgi:hypothetical protein